MNWSQPPMHCKDVCIYYSPQTIERLGSAMMMGINGAPDDDRALIEQKSRQRHVRGRKKSNRT